MANNRVVAYIKPGVVEVHTIPYPKLRMPKSETDPFGGKDAPYGFKTLHQLAIDTRFTPPRLIACDRANRRIVHLSMNGELLGVVGEDLLLPAAVAVRGDYAAVAELRGRVVLLDKNGAIASTLGSNTATDEIGNNRTEPAKWKPGIPNAPHGIAFDEQGNVYVSEFSLFGRLHKYGRQ